MLSLLVTLVIVPVQDRAISVAEFIKSFDDEKVKHTASKQMGEHIIFVHAPDQPSDEIKTKLAEALSASWRKTETGFRLERTQKQAGDLKAEQTAELAAHFREYQLGLRKKLQENVTAEQRANAALRSLLAFQEKYRISRPTAFQPETELAADWVLFSLLSKIDPKEIAAFPLYEGLQLSNKPSGQQLPFPAGSTDLIDTYVRDRSEISDFSQTMLDVIGEGPMSDWITDQINRAKRDSTLERVIVSYGRSSEMFSAGAFFFDTEGKIFDSSTAWIPSIRPNERIDVPQDLAAELSDVQRQFIEPATGYSFVNNPRPGAIDKVIGIEPLCATEPLFKALGERIAKPLIAVLDDRLLEAMDHRSGHKQSVAPFIRKAEDHGSIQAIADGEWLYFRPRYLIDSAARRVDRNTLLQFLASTKKAGFITIDAHIALYAASPNPGAIVLQSILHFVDRNGYVQVSEKDRYLIDASRLARELIKLRGGVPRDTIELPASSLSSQARESLWKWARSGVASLEPRPGHQPTDIERNANVALRGEVPSTAVVRISPVSAGSVGTNVPYPNTYSAEELGQACAGYRKPPNVMMEGNYFFGKRNGLLLEVFLTRELMLTNRYLETAHEMKEMRGYDALPADFRQEVERAYEDARKTLGDPANDNFRQR